MHYFHQMFGHCQEVRIPSHVMVSWEEKYSTIPAAMEKFNSILTKKIIKTLSITKTFSGPDLASPWHILALETSILVHNH